MALLPESCGQSLVGQHASIATGNCTLWGQVLKTRFPNRTRTAKLPMLRCALAERPRVKVSEGSSKGNGKVLVEEVREVGGIGPGPTRRTRVGEMSAEIKRMRAQMEENEDVASLMRGLRGQNLSDSQFAADDVKMRLVQVETGGEGEEELPLVYNPDTIASYWGRRPGAVAQRIVQLLAVAGGFLSGVASDLIMKKVKENEVLRAIQLREIVTSLGPAYIKLGQALSIRPDILSPAAMTELQKLCDKVPSFDNEVAMKLLEEELGVSPSDIFSELSPDPIAAASLGQVYKGKLKTTGEIVAVKVQRPYVLETVTIDLFIIRRLGLALRGVPQIATDIVGLVDEWAARFFEELDYVNEAANTAAFAESMAKDLPQVVVPKTFPEYTSRRVVVTGWIDGEKLSQSTASDVGSLVNVGVICYLKQLLDTGLFHADPHPGNLIRTPDGRLAVLDFGLMTRITEDQKYGMIEAISHLIHRDYPAIVEDFVLLDFIPEGVDLSPIMPVLARVFDQALEGGGAKGINFQELAGDLAQITFEYPFRIPPYFALIIRAIGVLEGIALVGDPDFAIVDAAYPYIAQRLLTDPSPRLRQALRYTIYGRAGIFDAERFIDVMEAFETFADTAKGGQGDLSPSHKALPSGGQATSLSRIPNVSSRDLVLFSPNPEAGQARAALAFLFSEEGSFFREFILDEIVKGMDAYTREQARESAQSLGILDLLRRTGNTSAEHLLLPDITVEDRAVLNNLRRVLQFLSGDSSGPGNLLGRQGSEWGALEFGRELLPLVPNVAVQVVPEVAARLSSRVAARFIRQVFLT